MINTVSIKSEFPIFSHDEQLVFLDNASTTQRPTSVIEAMSDFYASQNSNVHRGVYHLSNEASLAFENSRKMVAKFLNAPSEQSVVFTKGTTEGINIVAGSFLSHQLKEGDNVIISTLEHHANLIPWQQLCLRQKATLKVIQIDKNGNLNYEYFRSLLDDKTRLVAITHISNTTGTIVDIKSVIDASKSRNIPVMVDAAQSAATYTPDVQALDCDFLAFSGHKTFGPFGVGVLYVHPRFHAQMMPYNFGGGMIKEVKFEESKFRAFPHLLEPGTPAISEVIGLGEAIKYIGTLDKPMVNQKMHDLASHCRNELLSMDKVNLVGNPENGAPIISFTISGIHPHDIATFLAEDNIAVRAGHHCTQPLLDFLGVSAAVRASISIYNEQSDIDKLLKSIEKVKAYFL